MTDSGCTEPWTSNTTFRSHSESSVLSLETSVHNTSPSVQKITGEATMMANVKIIRSSSEGLAAISNLSKAASILLFTPVITPARHDKATHWTGTDPFESFGRALSTYHKRIRHVPFIPKIGYTDTHAAFLSQADAIIVVVCEPEDDKDQRISHQMAFALRALEAVQGKEANAANTLVLVQSVSEAHRLKANVGFKNVIEVSAYDDEVAKQIADAIFEPQQP